MSVAKPEVVITDWTFTDLNIENQLLQSKDIELVSKQCKTEAELIWLVSDADAVITQFAKINANVIGAMKKARAIVRYGIGVDNVDLEAARSRNIPVCNIPDYCMDEVADHTLAFVLATTRQVVPNTLHLHEGKWGLPVPLTAMQTLKTLTVGVIGFGRIGREVVRRLLAFKCRVLLFDPVVPATEIAKAGAEAAASLDTLLAQSDIVTPHCPSTPKTRHMFNTETFVQMKSGAIFINVGRGDLVDSNALVTALQSGKLSGAALDVFDPEPIPANNPILKMPNVILAAHIASASPAAVKRLRETAASIAALAVQGQPLPNIVNGVKSRA
ncbi:MAG: C-terminal binding protein [Verrucomicrobia bacterium]|nr:C-terminal binding protein [Verrucomicrobiota bacterium]